MSTSIRYDPDSGDESVNQPSIEERQLHTYKTLRQEILTLIESSFRQNTRIVGLVVITVGYGFQFDARNIIALVPVLLGYLIIRGLEVQATMINIAQQLVELEKELSPENKDDSPIMWESRRGHLGNTPEGFLKHARKAPVYARILILSIAYVASILFIPKLVWREMVLSGVIITEQHLLVTYVILTILIFVVSFSVWGYLNQAKKNVR